LTRPSELERLLPQETFSGLTNTQALFDAWADKLEAALDYRVVPIRKLVAVQLGAILAVGQHLSGERNVSRSNDPCGREGLGDCEDSIRGRRREALGGTPAG
jgi:hypothetical protein